jgi:methionyl-tRNA formyltransferase
MRVIFCGYRSWALNIIGEIKKHKKINSFEVISSKEEYDFKFNKLVTNADLIVFLGWSWIIPNEITKKYLCVGIHPSDLPDYRGGSPIQHQIINGIIETKISLMTISEKLDGGDIWLKYDLDLRGDTIEIIFKNLEESSIALFNVFFDLYPNINPIKQDLTKGSYFKRRKPRTTPTHCCNSNNFLFGERTLHDFSLITYMPVAKPLLNCKSFYTFVF